MRTTLDVNDALFTRAKAQALRENSTLTRLIEEGLRLRLSARPAAAKSLPKIPVYGGKGGLAKGIDQSSNRSLLDAADADA